MRFSGSGGGNASQWGRREAETALYAARGGGETFLVRFYPNPYCRPCRALSALSIT